MSDQTIGVMQLQESTRLTMELGNFLFERNPSSLRPCTACGDFVKHDKQEHGVKLELEGCVGFPTKANVAGTNRDLQRGIGPYSRHLLAWSSRFGTRSNLLIL